jgi:hypothetical protein
MFRNILLLYKKKHSLIVSNFNKCKILFHFLKFGYALVQYNNKYEMVMTLVGYLYTRNSPSIYGQFVLVFLWYLQILLFEQKKKQMRVTLISFFILMGE